MLFIIGLIAFIFLYKLCGKLEDIHTAIEEKSPDMVRIRQEREDRRIRDLINHGISPWD